MFVAAYKNTMANARPKLLSRAASMELADQREREREAAERALAAARRAAEAARDAALAEHVTAANAAMRMANDALRLYRKTGAPIDRIISRLARAHGVTISEIMSERRSAVTSLARQSIMYWACRLTRHSLPEIGRKLGRDHTTVLHAKNIYPIKRAKMGRTLRAVR